VNAPIDFHQVSPRELVSTSINNAADLLALAHHLIPGDRIDLFFSVAASKPDVAFGAFVTILNKYADLTSRALALRGLGRICHEPTLQEMRGCQTAFSQELVKVLVEEATRRGKNSNDLTRWAAAEAIAYIGYSPYVLQHSDLGGLTEPPERIAREIVESKLAQANQFLRWSSAGQEQTVEYERFIEFWIFGPIDRLYQTGYVSQRDMEITLAQLGLRGLEIALQPGMDEVVQKIAYQVLKWECQAYLNSKQRWKGEGLQRFLVEEAQSLEKADEFARILTVEPMQHPDNNFDHWTGERLHQDLEQTQQNISKIGKLSSVFSIICHLGALNNFAQTDYQEIIDRETDWKILMEGNISELESWKAKLLHNHQVLSNFLNEIHPFPQLYASIIALPIVNSVFPHIKSDFLDIQKSTIDIYKNYIKSLKSSIEKIINSFFDTQVVFYEKEMNSIGSKKHDIFMDVIHFDDKTSWFDSNVFITFIFPVLVFNIPIQFVVLFIVVFVAEFFLNKDAEEPFQIAGSITFTAFIVANIIRFLMQIDLIRFIVYTTLPLYLFCFFIIVFIRFRKDSLNRSYECKHNEVLQKIRDINGARRNTLSKLNNQWQD
jgi:hypothetical protein